MISEFSSTSAGGDKVRWIGEALKEIKKMPAVKGFILFNVDKETDWRFPPEAASGQALNAGLQTRIFWNCGKRIYHDKKRTYRAAQETS